MNPGFEQLQPYPFEKLAALKRAGSPVSGKPLIDLSLGEPKHKTAGLHTGSADGKPEPDRGVSRNPGHGRTARDYCGVVDETVLPACLEPDSRPGAARQRHAGSAVCHLPVSRRSQQGGSTGRNPQPVLPDLRRRRPARRGHPLVRQYG